jgi:hypothetical protein
VAAKLASDAIRELGVGWPDGFEWIVKTELPPLVSAHLVETQNLDPLNRLEPSTDIGYLFHVIVIIGEARHQDETYPHGALQCRKASCKVESQLQRLAP